MSGYTYAFDASLLAILLNGTALANVFDNAASSPITQVYLSGHTSDPGKGGNQQTNEIAYGSYARIAVVRNGTAWTVDPLTGIAVPVSALAFPTPTSGSGTITHIGIGRDASGAGYLFASGPVTPNLIITVGFAPQLTTSSQIQGLPST